jgi:sortase A
MKAKLGTFLMLLGAAMICGSLGLLLFNQQQQTMAARSVDAVMPQLVTAIHESKRLPEESQPPQELPLQQREMVVQEIDGHNYIGFVGIPALELELPVMADWTYPQLKIAPCRFTGSIFTDDLVIMAHNFERHFGRIRDLKPGDTVTFTDMEGQTISYEVVVLDILHPTAVEDMTAGEYDLTLFTCTYGGKSRVTVRCDRME